MHLSMHNWMRAEPLEKTVARLARYGYKSIELSGEPEKYNTGEVRPLLQRYGIRCWGAVTLMLGQRNLLAKDPGQRAASVEYVKQCVTLVQELDGFEVTVVPGTVGKIEPEATPEEEWVWAVDSMQEVYAFAQQEGVRLAIEPINRFETYFVSRSNQALALAEATGADCGICLDAFHINMEEADPHQAIRDVAPRLIDFHVADTNRMACGMGAWDWPGLVETLKDVGYDGALTVEFVAPIDRTPANPYPDAVEQNPVDITPEELKFIQDHGSSLISEGFYDLLTEKTAQTLLPLIA
ncbi:MAG: TIM barrel protein [Candidatus Latescibacteria bacterium]|nr:TIM barrel protein [Candidatus Latescibacterota bacterium]